MFNSTMQSSRSGRKLNQAVQNTSRAVASTGKVVGMCNNINYNYFFCDDNIVFIYYRRCYFTS